ncbi:MAG: glucose-6-phosphate dehydrogenase, partial [Hyphomicrobiales bacterium]
MTSQIIPVAPFDFVIFGGTGDLSRRKLLPALYMRDRDGQIPDESRIIAVSRANMDQDAFRALALEALVEHLAADALDETCIQRFL